VPEESTEWSHSILFDPAAGPVLLQADEPRCFRDTNLDQVVAAATAGRDEYDLSPLFYTPLSSVAAITYRHAAFHDLEREDVAGAVGAFANTMRATRASLGNAAKLRYARQAQALFLDAVENYLAAVNGLLRELRNATLHSSAMRHFREYLSDYVASAEYTALFDETVAVRNGLDSIEYLLHIEGNRITVTAYEGEPDYSDEVEATFRKFHDGDVRSHLVTFADPLEMNHVEAGVLELVAAVFPKEFGALAEFRASHRDFLNADIATFDREAQFHAAYVDYCRPISWSGLSVTYPFVSESKDEEARDIYDLALAAKLVANHAQAITNDYSLTDGERIIVVSGANQGGKTTFARTFGQLHYLAGLGLPVASSEARLLLTDGVFTHFERQEDLGGLSGKLEDDLIRLHETLATATSRSVIILNEIFTSTTFADAIQLGTEILHRILALGALCVCVTFVDELSTLSEATVSMVAEVDQRDSTRRTFKLSRRPADGLAHALALAEHYGLDFEHFVKRIRS
jgi:DNA mismatch repair ATPase MutS